MFAELLSVIIDGHRFHQLSDFIDEAECFEYRLMTNYWACDRIVLFS